MTYIIDGTFRHQDSNGGGGMITNGDTQWMTAGGGILHIEEPPEAMVASGGLFHGFQLWVNLPSRMKMTSPRYQDIRAGQVKLLSSPDGGALIRLIAGEVAGHQGPGITHTPIALLHASLEPGAQLRLPWSPGFNALGYVLAGSGTVGAEQRPVRMGQLAVFGHGEVITVAAERRADGPSTGMDILILGGQPIREPVAAYGPFVMNTRDRSWSRRSRTIRPGVSARSRRYASRYRPKTTPVTTCSEGPPGSATGDSYPGPASGLAMTAPWPVA